MNIKNIVAREILDSRGNPTVSVDVILENNMIANAKVPSGASTGSKEAMELRDGGTRYHGKGVLNAVNNVNTEIKDLLIGQNVTDQREIDNAMIELDGTENKSRLGANAMLGVSVACLKAAAMVNNKELFEYAGNGDLIPTPMMNIVNGGAHADNSVDFQEFMIIPNTTTVKERVRMGSEVFHSLKNVLKEKGYNTAVGDEGGFAPNLKSNTEALDLIIEAIEKSGLIPGKDIFLGLDVAASEFYNKETKMYELVGEDKNMTSLELTDFFVTLVKEYPIISIEDSHSEFDWDGFIDLTKKIGKNVQLVGDDLFVTNQKILQRGIDEKACNSILIKPNQIGTITETIDTINLAKKNGYKTIISHRSGETEDTFIADLSVSLNLGQIKTGSLSRSERVAKYNRLMLIEDLIK